MSEPTAPTGLAEIAQVQAQHMLQAWQLVLNGLAARLGAPVYLVGSALRKDSPPDWDLRITLTDADMTRLFGPPDPSERTIEDLDGPRAWRVRYEQLKQSRRLSRLLRRNIDFQIQTETEAKKYDGLPRLRADRAPDWLFEAGLADA